MASGSTKVVIAALIGNSAIAVTKFIAATITGSSAMFAEGVHSLVDTGNQALLLFGINRSSRPADERHPFGYGKEIYFWAFVVAILLFALGAGISLYEGIHKIQHPHPITNAGWNYLVLALAIAFESVAWWIAYKEFNKVRGDTPIFQAVRQSKDPALFTVLFEDTAAMLGLFAALIGIYCADQLGILWADGAATLAIGMILTVAAIILAYETKGLLIGEAAGSELVNGVIKTAMQQAFIKNVNEARTLHFGPEDVLVNLSVDVNDNASGAQIEEGVSQLERMIKERYPDVKRIFIEVQGARASDAQIPEGDNGGEPST